MNFAWIVVNIIVQYVYNRQVNTSAVVPSNTKNIRTLYKAKRDLMRALIS